MAREIRVTFTEKEEDLYKFIKSKSSASSFIKDLVSVEKERQKNYTNPKSNNNIDEIIDIISNKLDLTNLKKETKTEYDFDINDII